MPKLTQYTGNQSTMIEPVICRITGDPKVGVETANRRPPAFGVMRTVRQLPPTNVGATVLFRNDLARMQGTALRAWIPSPANVAAKKEG